MIVMPCALLGSEPPEAYFLTEIQIEEAERVSAFAVNENGIVAGSTAIRYESPGFAWRAPNEYVLNTLPCGAVRVNDLNNSGSVSVRCDSSWGSSRAGAFIDRHYVDIGILDGYDGGECLGLNDLDEFVGCFWTNDTLDRQPFYWSEKTGLVLLPFLTSRGIANDINNAGTIVGASTDAHGTFRPALWEGGQLRFLSSLPGRGQGEAKCVTESDGAATLVCGACLSSTTAPYWRGALWRRTPDGKGGWSETVEELPPIDPADETYARAMNVEEIVVGHGYDRDRLQSTGALRWHAGSVRSLTAMIPEDSEWTLSYCNDMSEAGLIVCDARKEGADTDRAVLLTPTALRTSPIVPQNAGRENVLRVSGAEPGGLVRLLVSEARGYGRMEECGGMAVGIDNPQSVASAIADAQGEAVIRFFVPAGAAGRELYLQAVQRSACVVGLPERVIFE